MIENVIMKLGGGEMAEPIESIGYDYRTQQISRFFQIQALFASMIIHDIKIEIKRLRPKSNPKTKSTLDELSQLLLRLEINQGEMGNVGALAAMASQLQYLLEILSTMPGSPNQLRSLEKMVRNMHRSIMPIR